MMNGMVLGALILLVFLGHNSLATQVRDVQGATTGATMRA